MIKSRETCSNDELTKIFFRGVEVKKSEIRLKSENLHLPPLPNYLGGYVYWRIFFEMEDYVFLPSPSRPLAIPLC